jgi:hypothetical protein
MKESDRRVVWISREDVSCAGCGRRIAAAEFVGLPPGKGPRCLSCEGLADLVFLPSGDPAMTRRAAASSPRHAIVVEFVRRRNRNERRGTLVDPGAVERAKESCAQDAPRRAKTAVKRRARDEVAERLYLERFAERIFELFPGCPREEAWTIARHACEKHSGRVGRSADAKKLDPAKVDLAVRAHIRHVHTEYDALLGRGLRPREARPLIRGRLEAVAAEWKRRP